jgi:hypothetical protein
VAERLGATLDATLSLYDAQGRLLASNDDAQGSGRDPLLEFKVPSAGRYWLAVSGVTEKAGAAAVYLLTVTQPPDSTAATNHSVLQTLGGESSAQHRTHPGNL